MHLCVTCWKAQAIGSCSSTLTWRVHSKKKTFSSRNCDCLKKGISPRRSMDTKTIHRTDEPLGGERREKPQEKTEQIQPTCCRLKTRQSLWSQMDSSTFLCGNWCSRRIARFGVGAHVRPTRNYWLGTETVDARCSRHGDLLQPLHVPLSLPQTMGTTGTDGPMERGQW